MNPPVMHKAPTAYAGMADCGTGMSVLEHHRASSNELAMVYGYSSRLTDTRMDEGLVNVVSRMQHGPTRGV